MKITVIFAFVTLSVIVKGAFWAAAVQPVILSLGAVLAAIDLDVLDVQASEWNKWKVFKIKRAELDENDAKEIKYTVEVHTKEKEDKLHTIEKGKENKYESEDGVTKWGDPNMTEEERQKFMDEQDRYDRIVNGEEKLEEDFHTKVSMMQDDM